MSQFFIQLIPKNSKPKKAIVGFCLLLLAGCCTPASVDRSVIQPLPEKAEPRSYRELTLRLRGQATVAMEGFYTNDWDSIQTAAKAINQTANLLPKATDIPEPSKTKVVVVGPTLEKESLTLLSSARNREVQSTLDSIHRIHLEIRQLNMAP